jgi:hypothetical protein
MTHPSSRRIEMSKPRKIQRKLSPLPAAPRQMSMAFESNRLLGLPSAERMKALMDLAYLLTSPASALRQAIQNP